MKEVYGKQLSAASKKGKAKDNDKKETAVQIELEEKPVSTDLIVESNLDSNGNMLVVKKDGQHAAEAEMMVPIRGSNLPRIRLDGPYGTASGYVISFLILAVAMFLLFLYYCY